MYYTNVRCSLKFTSDGKVFAAVNSGCDLFEPGKRVEDTERIIAEDIRYVTDILNILRGAFTG